MAYQVIQTKGSSRGGRLGQAIGSGLTAYRQQQLLDQQRRDERKALEDELATRRYGYELGFLGSMLPHMTKTPKFDASQYKAYITDPASTLRSVISENPDLLEKKVFDASSDEEGNRTYRELSEEEILMLTDEQLLAFQGKPWQKESLRKYGAGMQQEVDKYKSTWEDYRLPSIDDNITTFEALAEDETVPRQQLFEEALRSRKRIQDDLANLKRDRGAVVGAALLTDGELNQINRELSKRVQRVNAVIKQLGMAESVQSVEEAERLGLSAGERTDSAKFAQQHSGYTWQEGSRPTEPRGGMPNLAIPGSPAAQRNTQFPDKPGTEPGIVQLARKAIGGAKAITPDIKGGFVPPQQTPSSDQILKGPMTGDQAIRQGLAGISFGEGSKRYEPPAEYQGGTELYSYAKKYGQQFGVDMDTIQRTVQRESAGGKYNLGDKESPRGPSYGPMQVNQTGALAQWNMMHPTEQHTPDEAMTYDVGMKIGVWYLRYLMDEMMKRGVEPSAENIDRAYMGGLGAIAR